MFINTRLTELIFHFHKNHKLWFHSRHIRESFEEQCRMLRILVEDYIKHYSIFRNVSRIRSSSPDNKKLELNLSVGDDSVWAMKNKLALFF